MVSYLYVGNAYFESKSKFNIYNLEQRVQKSLNVLSPIFSNWMIRFSFHYWLWRMIMIYSSNSNPEYPVLSSNFPLVKGWDYSGIKWIGKATHLNVRELEKSQKHFPEGDRMLFFVSCHSCEIMWATSREGPVAFESYRSSKWKVRAVMRWNSFVWQSFRSRLLGLIQTCITSSKKNTLNTVKVLGLKIGV